MSKYCYNLEEFKRCPNSYHRLNCNKQWIGDVGATALAEALKGNSTVSSIWLRFNQIGAVGATALTEALKGNSTVSEIDLDSNQISDEGAKALAGALKVNSTVSRVSLDSNQISDEGAKALAGALKVNSTVSAIQLNSNQIGAEGAKALAGALKVNSTVSAIYLGSNQIGDEGATALAEALKINSTVSSIWLNSNQIGAEGAKALAGALKANSTVSRINLVSNQIGAVGAKALAEALKGNSTVSEIYLDSNQISDEGAKALAGALKVNSTVSAIQLNSNQIGDEGAKALAGALKVNSTVRDIHLNSNQIGAVGAKALVEALKYNQNPSSSFILDWLDWTKIISKDIWDILVLNIRLNKIINPILNEGDKYKNASNYNRAIECYKQVEEYPRANIHIKLGECYEKINYEKINEYNKAIDHYNKAISFDKDNEEIVKLCEYGIKISSAKGHNSEGNFAEALKIAEELLRIDSIDKVALAIKKTAYDRLGDQAANLSDWDNAITHYNAALYAEDDKVIKAKKGDMLCKKRSFTEALNFYAKNSEGYFKVHKELGDQDLTKCAYGDAIKNYTNLVTESGEVIRGAENIVNANLYENLAKCYRSIENFSTGLVFINKALSLDSTSFSSNNEKVEILINLAELMKTKKDYAKALEHLNSAKSIKSIKKSLSVDIATKIDAITSLKSSKEADEKYTKGSYSEAVEIYKEILTSSPDDKATKNKILESLEKIADKLKEDKKYPEAQKSYEELVKMSSTYATGKEMNCNKNMLVCYKETKNYTKALEIADKLLESNQSDQDVIATKVIVLKESADKDLEDAELDNNKYKDALEKYKKIFNYERTQEIKTKIASVMIKQKNFEDALKYAEKNGNEYKEALKGHAGGLLANQDLNQALEKYKELYELNKEDVAAKTSIGNILEQQGENKAALAYFNPSSEKYKSTLKKLSGTFKAEADELCQQADYSAALGKYDLAIEQEPGNEIYVTAKADCLLKLEKYDEALKIIGNHNTTSIKLLRGQILNKKALLCYNDATTLRSTEALKEALELFEEASKFCKDQESILTMSKAYIEIGDNDKALANLHLLEDDFSNVKEIKLFLLNTKAMEAYEREDYENATLTFKDALEIDSRNVEITNNLAWALMAKGEYSASNQYFDLVITDNEQARIGKSICLNHIGKLYLSEKSYKEAIDSFKKALELVPGDDIYLSNLGRAYLANGDYDEALKCFKDISLSSPLHEKNKSGFERFDKADALAKKADYLFEKETNFAEAKKLAQEALEIVAEHSLAVDVLRSCDTALQGDDGFSSYEFLI